MAPCLFAIFFALIHFVSCRVRLDHLAPCHVGAFFSYHVRLNYPALCRVDAFCFMSRSLPCLELNWTPEGTCLTKA